MGFVGSYHNDYNSYLAWMRQAWDGHVLFKDLYSTEPHNRIFFHPLFWAMGATARAFGVSFLAVWYLAQAAADVLMVFTIYRFAAHFLPNRSARRLALVLATTASGLGWLTTPAASTPWVERSIDLWLAEANGLRAAVTSFFTLPLSLSFLLLAMLRGLRYFRDRRRIDVLWAGGYALALAATHQYDMVTLYAVLGLYSLLALRQRIRGFAVIIAISIPFVLYSVVVVVFDPVFSQHRAIVMESPTVASYILGWGIPVAAALIALASPSVRRTGRDLGFLAVVLGVGLALLAIPIGFQRKLCWGLHPAMCVLAATLVVTVVEKTASRLVSIRWRAVAVAGFEVAFAAFCAVGSIGFYDGLFVRNAKPQPGDYMPSEWLAAFSYIERNSSSDDVVLANQPLAAMIPGRTGRAVFAGHWAQTIDYRAKLAFVQQLLSGAQVEDKESVLAILRKNRVRLLVQDRLGDDPSPAAQPLAPLQGTAKLVFENRFVRIWSVEG